MLAMIATPTVCVCACWPSSRVLRPRGDQRCGADAELSAKVTSKVPPLQGRRFGSELSTLKGLLIFSAPKVIFSTPILPEVIFLTPSLCYFCRPPRYYFFDPLGLFF